MIRIYNMCTDYSWSVHDTTVFDEKTRKTTGSVIISPFPGDKTRNFYLEVANAQFAPCVHVLNEDEIITEPYTLKKSYAAPAQLIRRSSAKNYMFIALQKEITLYDVPKNVMDWRLSLFEDGRVIFFAVVEVTGLEQVKFQDASGATFLFGLDGAYAFDADGNILPREDGDIGTATLQELEEAAAKSESIDVENLLKEFQTTSDVFEIMTRTRPAEFLQYSQGKQDKISLRLEPRIRGSRLFQ